MKKFIIRYATQAFFRQGFCMHTEEVWGAVNAHRMLKSIRAGKYPAVAVWITCG